MPHHQHTTISPLTTFLIAVFFLVALFPSLFVSIAWAPYNSLVNYYFPTAEPRKTVICASPNICSAPPSDNSMSWFQKSIALPARSRGSYLVTDDIAQALPEIGNYKVGLVNLFIQHTSCALSLNENWDEDVRADMTDALDRIVPEDNNNNKGQRLYRHDAEGSDDMPAHVKSALVGASVTIPITNGRLNMGTWQGIWYLEFRNAKHARKIVATIQGEKI